MHKILMIDDDERLCQLVGEYLQRYGHQLDCAPLPSRGRALLAGNGYDLLILDVMLPEMDGLSLCREIRKTSDIPIIMLTARGEVMDRVVGLELGADDYLAKPFEPRELLARLQNILRRAQRSGGKLCYGSLTVEPDRRRALLADQELNLSTMEYQLLELLAKHPGKTFTRDEILNQLKGIDADIYTRSVDILVSRLRQKLEPLDLIKTVRGSGYVLVGGE